MKRIHLRRLYTPILTLLLLSLLNFVLPPYSPATGGEQTPAQIYASLPQAGEFAALPDPQAQAVRRVYEPGFTPQAGVFKVYYLANSHAYVVADDHPGDLSAPHWLQALLVERQGTAGAPFEVRSGALPDMTQSEFLIRLVAAGEAAGASPDLLIGGISLRRPTQENAVRPEAAALLASPQVQAQLRALLQASPDLPYASHLVEALLAPSTLPGAGEAASAGDLSLPVRGEAALQSRLDENLALFAARARLRQALVVRLVLWRNRLFGVTSSTPRPFSHTLYRANLELIEMALRYARSQHLPVLLYLDPLRPLQPNPTPLQDVDRFRTDLPALCERYDAVCYDYTELLPESCWTVLSPDDETGFGGQPDYYHFTAAGHKILAQQLFQDLQSWLDAWAAP